MSSLGYVEGDWADAAFVMQSRRPSVAGGRVDPLFLTAILGVAASVRLWAISFGLPHPNARPDEEAVASIASAFYLGVFGETNFIYPPLFMLVLAGTWRLVFSLVPPTLAWMHIRPATFARTLPAERLTARLLSAAAGTVSVWLVFRIGLRLFGRSAAFTGAGSALAFLHVRDSHFGVTDIPMTCMVLVAFLAIVKLSESGSDRDLATASLLTGLAVATRYNAALLVLPATFAIRTTLVDVRSSPVSVGLRFTVCSCWERFSSSARTQFSDTTSSSPT